MFMPKSKHSRVCDDCKRDIRANILKTRKKNWTIPAYKLWDYGKNNHDSSIFSF